MGQKIAEMTVETKEFNTTLVPGHELVVIQQLDIGKSKDNIDDSKPNSTGDPTASVNPSSPEIKDSDSVSDCIKDTQSEQPVANAKTELDKDSELYANGEKNNKPQPQISIRQPLEPLLTNCQENLPGSHNSPDLARPPHTNSINIPRNFQDTPLHPFPSSYLPLNSLHTSPSSSYPPSSSMFASYYQNRRYFGSSRQENVKRSGLRLADVRRDKSAEERASILRDEIARQTASLHRLERLAMDLPKIAVEADKIEAKWNANIASSDTTVKAGTSDTASASQQARGTQTTANGNQHDFENRWPENSYNGPKRVPRDAGPDEWSYRQHGDIGQAWTNDQAQYADTGVYSSQGVSTGSFRTPVPTLKTIPHVQPSSASHPSTIAVPLPSSSLPDTPASANSQISRASRTSRNSGWTFGSSGGGSVFSVSNNSKGSSRMIDNLQTTIDALRRDLREQTEKANEERNSRTALKKRTDNMESQLQVLKHQNEMLNSMMTRKERRIEELEQKLDRFKNEIRAVEEEKNVLVAIRSEYEEKISGLSQERERLDAGYQMLMESSRRSKKRQENDLDAICRQLTAIQTDRQEDRRLIEALNSKVKEQQDEKEKLQAIFADMKRLRKEHLEAVEKKFDDVKRYVEISDQRISQNVENTLKEIQGLQKRWKEDERMLEPYEDESDIGVERVDHAVSRKEQKKRLLSTPSAPTISERETPSNDSPEIWGTPLETPLRASPMTNEKKNLPLPPLPTERNSNFGGPLPAPLTNPLALSKERRRKSQLAQSQLAQSQMPQPQPQPNNHKSPRRVPVKAPVQTDTSPYTSPQNELYLNIQGPSRISERPGRIMVDMDPQEEPPKHENAFDRPGSDVPEGTITGRSQKVRSRVIEAVMYAAEGMKDGTEEGAMF